MINLFIKMKLRVKIGEEAKLYKVPDYQCIEDLRGHENKR